MCIQDELVCQDCGYNTYEPFKSMRAIAIHPCATPKKIGHKMIKNKIKATSGTLYCDRCQAKRKAKEDKLEARKQTALRKAQEQAIRADERTKMFAERKAARAQARKDQSAARKKEKEAEKAEAAEVEAERLKRFEEYHHLKKKKSTIADLMNPVWK